MEFKILVPSYLESNHINSLRHELCEIIYEDYKGTTFFLNQQLEEKKIVLDKVYKIIKENPEIFKYREDSNYWYPYENVDGSRSLNLHASFYPNTNDGITYFCKKGEDEWENQDYLFDPVKLHFFLMCNDIKKMDCTSDTAKEIIKINNELFQVLFETIGDTISYNGLNTLEHIQKYIQNGVDEELKAKNDMEMTADYKNMLLRSYRSFNDFSYLLNETIAVCREYGLQKELPVKESNTIKKKI